MIDKPLVSLCMPTNGVIEWVFPVLESIYDSKLNPSLFEVVITDNGNNVDFKTKIKEYIQNKSNIIYIETEAPLFLNEIESYKNANGELIKFVNHRTKVVDGTIEKLIGFVEKNKESKPIIYFSNGVLEGINSIVEYDNFDSFVLNLSYWSSWSTGMSIWKSDFDNMPKEISEYDELFPHMTALFYFRDRNKYIIDNSLILDEIPAGKKPKGNYDLFYAFGVEYPNIIAKLLNDRSICEKTYRKVLNENLNFVADQYINYFIRKMYCSYDLSGMKKIYGVYYSWLQIHCRVAKRLLAKVIHTTIRQLKN